MSLPPREHFSLTESRRPPFPRSNSAPLLGLTQQPDPTWQPGQGLNSLPSSSLFRCLAAEDKSDPLLFTHIDPSTVKDKSQLYKLMIGGIVPRPIAFLSTQDAEGRPNLAPFSFCSPVGYRPPLLSVHFSHPVPFAEDTPEQGRQKDSLNNILTTKQFTANIISESFIEAANICAITSPPGVSEWVLSGLTPIPSDEVKPARVGESAFSMECELEMVHPIHQDGLQTGTLILGRIVRFHVRTDLFDDRGGIDSEKLGAVGRMGGIRYSRTREVFDVKRWDWKEVQDGPLVKDLLAERRHVDT